VATQLPFPITARLWRRPYRDKTRQCRSRSPAPDGQATWGVATGREEGKGACALEHHHQLGVATGREEGPPVHSNMTTAATWGVTTATGTDGARGTEGWVPSSGDGSHPNGDGSHPLPVLCVGRSCSVKRGGFCHTRHTPTPAPPRRSHNEAHTRHQHHHIAMASAI